ncbi:hypothetical protein KM540_gp021 [Western grey kangaroopox virus]|uniref:Uncharacterized protein n=1 Tax=Western grey kangaroopox virus TaxID=1566307 RepID=A0A2C9DSG9_9POXV|nr:hypothetical protein KM540_gp021 [Western grey kangaroopox virus]ATI20952.1 hypothetical protein [Western grey kangaroopox virus]
MLGTPGVYESTAYSRYHYAEVPFATSAQRRRKRIMSRPGSKSARNLLKLFIVNLVPNLDDGRSGQTLGPRGSAAYRSRADPTKDQRSVYAPGVEVACANTCSAIAEVRLVPSSRVGN